MNKLYIIKFMLKNDFCVSVFSCWNLETLEKKIADNSNYCTFEIVENNDTHTIYKAF